MDNAATSHRALRFRIVHLVIICSKTLLRRVIWLLFNTLLSSTSSWVAVLAGTTACCGKRRTQLEDVYTHGCVCMYTGLARNTQLCPIKRCLWPVQLAQSQQMSALPCSLCTWQNVLMARSMPHVLLNRCDSSDPGKPRYSSRFLLMLLVAVSVTLQTQSSAPVQLSLLQLQQLIPFQQPNTDFCHHINRTKCHYWRMTCWSQTATPMWYSFSSSLPFCITFLFPLLFYLAFCLVFLS